MAVGDDDRNSFQRRADYERAMEALKVVTGSDQLKRASDTDRATQRVTFAQLVRQVYDGGWDRMTLIESLLAGACFLADNHGVSRQQLCAFVAELALSKDRELVYAPPIAASKIVPGGG